MCIFCDISKNNNRIINEDDLVFAIYDAYPVNKGHVLIITKRHVSSYFELTQDENLSIQNMITSLKIMLDKKFIPDGYNIGINIGEYAGQTVMHCHVHLIPRYKGDIDNPRGGVRGVIPKKRIY